MFKVDDAETDTETQRSGHVEESSEETEERVVKERLCHPPFMHPFTQTFD